jgi:S-DNA-T family DNA segregation ATPase FtsK/SpoIIIE
LRKPGESQKEDLGRIAFGAWLLLLWLFLCVSVLSYTPDDLPTKFVYHESERIDNIAGLLGAWCASLCTWCFGAASYFLVVLMGIAVLCYWLDWTRDLWLKTLGSFLMLVAVSGFSAFLINSSSGSPVGPGGCVGALLKFLLEQAFVPLGSYIALLGLFSAGLILILPNKALSFLFWSTGLARAVVRIAAPFCRRIYEARPEGIEISLVREMSKGRAQPNVVPALQSPYQPRVAINASPSATSAGQTTRTSRIAPVILSDSVARADRPIEVNVSDFAAHDPYDKDRDPLFAQAFGPQVVEKPTFQFCVDMPDVSTQDPQNVANESVCVQGSKNYDESEDYAEDYVLPSIELLEPADYFDYGQFREEIEERGRELERVCQTFGVDLKVVDVQTGPVLTMYEIELKEGLRVKKLNELTKDLEIALKAESVRIVSPIPGKNTVGVELPNQNQQMVRLREVIEACQDQTDDFDIPVFLGKDVVGNPMVADLAKLPHLLVAGRTGTGKSVCLNSIIMSILMTRTPKQCKMIMIDPKMVELGPYKSIPHLMHPVVIDMEKAEAILEWAVEQMEKRYKQFARVGARKLSEFNKMPLQLMRKRLNPRSEAEWMEFPKSMPSIVIVADEMADLIMTSGKDVERHIIRLAQKSRAVGIHLVLATQKPTVDVITGLIKSNLPARISFAVATQMDSRVVLDEKGAESLLGNGDMLFLQPGTSQTIRGQGAFVSDYEIDAVIDFIAVAEPKYDVVIETKTKGESKDDEFGETDMDEYYIPAVDFVIGEGRASTSLLQRKFSIGYGRASRIVDMMAENGIVSPFNPAKPSRPRDILITMEQWRGQQDNPRTTDDNAGETLMPVVPAPESVGIVIPNAKAAAAQKVSEGDKGVQISKAKSASYQEYNISPTSEPPGEPTSQVDGDAFEDDVLDNEFEEEVAETAVESSSKTGWTPEQWDRYLDFDIDS